jgi:hypothetical protein
VTYRHTGGTAYLNKNFLIPNYLELSSSSETDEPIFSRSISDQQLIGNQLTSVFNIPNTYLNNIDIPTQWLYGQTNMAIASDNRLFKKNIYENVYFNEIMTMNIIDNTNGLYKFNQDASNKFANSIWNKLDEANKRLYKVRYNKNDGTEPTYSNLYNVTYNSEDNTITFNYQLYQDGTIASASIVSYDETTTYATYVIPLEEKIYTVTQAVHLEYTEKYGG